MDNSMLLSLITFSPLLAILVLAFVPKRYGGIIKQIGILGTLLPLVLSLMLFANFDYQLDEMQFVEHVPWIEVPIGAGAGGELFTFPISYDMGVDGISMPLIVLTAIVGTMAAVASWQIKRRLKEYFLLFHLLLIGMFGVFATQNLLLFFIFFELTLIPAYFLIGIWGFSERERAANKFLIYNGIGSAIMLLAFIAIIWLVPQVNADPTMSMTELRNVLTSPDFQAMMEQMKPGFLFGLFLALFIAFGIKLPIFPFHTWMLKVHVQAPVPVVMIHSGILLKMGAYGLIRLGIGLFPEQAYSFAAWMAVLGVVNILYGAVLAFVQNDLKMVMAYSSISHMGIVLLGFAAMNTIGFQGAIFQTISHGFISALLFLMIGVIWERVETSQIDELGGLAKSMPFASGILLTAAMASLGLPGMSGFISEFLAFLGLFGTMPVIGSIGVLGIILTAVYLLRAVLRTTFGPMPDRFQRLADAQPLEVLPMIVLLGFIILLGIYPAVLSDPLQETLKTIVPIVTGIGG
ncbi:MAG: NADH-quinone oxidoreductase subunit M [Brevibacillus sp.]|nr:NADH-quinone oxidoreductase subunit M [Brevibacillus sp.]